MASLTKSLWRYHSQPPREWCLTARPWFNIKMSSYQYRKSHCGDKTFVRRTSYLHNGISYTGKMSSLYWIRALEKPISEACAHGVDQLHFKKHDLWNVMFNSLAPGKFKWNFRHAIFKQIFVIDGWGISCEIDPICHWTSLMISQHWFR